MTMYWGDDSKHASAGKMERIKFLMSVDLLNSAGNVSWEGATLVMISEVQSRINWVKSLVESMILVAVE